MSEHQGEWMIRLPTSLQLSKRGEPYQLNLNVYRNTHYQTLNKAKVAFSDAVTPLLAGVPVLGCVKLSYRLFVSSKARRDVANICCVVDKFFSDVLASAGKIPDDTWKYLPAVEYVFAGVDPKDPRVEVVVFNIPE